jgi:hypothetical protein
VNATISSLVRAPAAGRHHGTAAGQDHCHRFELVAVSGEPRRMLDLVGFPGFGPGSLRAAS